MRPTVLAFVSCLAATPALSHPHVFINVDLTLTYTDGLPSGVTVAWVYDDYISLLITSDLGLDLDGDLQLTPEEEAILAGAAADWPEDFNGDLEVLFGDAPITLEPRIDHTLTFDNGIVREVHTRPITVPDSETPLTIRTYDPFYYISYDLIGPLTILGRDDCTADITRPDLNKAYAMAEELLYGRAASDVGADEDFPEIGVQFAETIVVQCAPF